MLTLAVGSLALLLSTSSFSGGTSKHESFFAASSVQQLPSEAEIDELLSKAAEYANSYRQTFTSAKPSLDKAPTPGFYEKGIELSSQASETISAIRKNGRSAYALVGLIAILDDMTINATRAYAVTMLVASGESSSNPKDRAMQDFQDLAQAGKNCYDISDLILHATLRLIHVEEQTLQTLSTQGKR
jgi:hypothetical protein